VTVRRVVPVLSSVLVLGALASAARSGDPLPLRMPELIERYRSDADDIRSFYGVPFSTVREGRLAELEDAVAEQIRRVRVSDPIPKDHAIDAVLLSDHLDHARARRAWDHAQDERAAPLVPFAADLVALEEARRAMEPVEPRAAAKVLDAARVALEDVRKRLDKGKDDADALQVEPPVALRASRSVEALKRALGDWFRYRDGYEPDFAWWVRTPYQQLDKALGEYAKHLREKLAGQTGDDAPLVGEPIGAEALAEALRHERIAYTAEELIAIAERHMAWCDEEGRRASEEMGLGGDWMAAVERVKQAVVAPGEMDDLVAAQGREAVAFVTSRGLVDVPELCAELWNLEMISKEGQRTLPFAAYSGNRMLVASPTEDMDQDAKEMSLRGNNRHFSRIVVPHELIPGHHLQMFHAERHRPYRGLFSTPFLVEGWALYWEMRLWEQGWAQSPEDRIGMLFWRKHRCARVIVSLRFHLGEMTTQEMIDFLTTRVGLEKDGATAEVRRYVGGGYGPLYQAAYLIGGMQLRALHREAVESGRLREADFHRPVLEQGPIPVDAIRRDLLGLPADGGPRWRFAD